MFHIPENHRRKIRTSNLVERQMKEIKRQTRGVGVFPNAEDLPRLAAILLIEKNNQWLSDIRYLTESKDRPVLMKSIEKRLLNPVQQYNSILCFPRTCYLWS